MPTLLHEGLLALVRERPALVADVLRELLGVRVPAFREARITEASLPELVPTEYHADLAVILARDRPVLGVVLEVQLRPKRRKRYTWPLYATAGRARHECPFVLIVIAPSEATARWASKPIDLGDGNTWTPHVLGPTEIPKVTDPARAARAPELAVLSVIAHGRGPVETASAIAVAAIAGLENVPDELRLLYSALIERSLSETTRKRIAMLTTDLEKFLSKRERKALAKARAEAKAEVLVRILDERGIALTEGERARILGCTNIDEVGQWLDRAFSASRAEEIFG